MRHLIKSGNVRQIADSRRKPEAENGADGKNMIREAAGISIVLVDLPSSVVLQQTIENVRRFVGGRGNDLRRIGSVLIRDMTVR